MPRHTVPLCSAKRPVSHCFGPATFFLTSFIQPILNKYFPLVYHSNYFCCDCCSVSSINHWPRVAWKIGVLCWNSNFPIVSADTRVSRWWQSCNLAHIFLFFYCCVPVAHTGRPSWSGLKLLPNWHFSSIWPKSRPPPVQIGPYCIYCGTLCRCAVPGDLLLHPALQSVWSNDYLQGGEHH